MPSTILPPQLLILYCLSTAHAASIKGSGALEPGLQGRDDIVFFTDFESNNWRSDWGHKEDGRSITVTEDPKNKFAPFSGKALRIEISEGKHYGTSFSFKFKQQLGEEPESIYFRYYLRFGDTWSSEGSGKLPGIAGTYDRAGWGGRRADGKNGWSARGLFLKQQNGKTPIGYYPYHADMGKWGAHWSWKEQERGYLENNRWYCVEQYIQLNTPGTNGGPGLNNGIMRGWIDGQLAFEKSDIRMRDINSLKIEKVWIDVYYGGSWTPKHNMYIYMDNMVIARKPIGPLKADPVKKKDIQKETIKTESKKAALYTAKPGAIKQYTDLLKQICQASLDANRRPRFVLDALKTEVEIVAIENAGARLQIPKLGSTMNIKIWDSMNTKDCQRLAKSLAHRQHPLSKSVLAFFSLVNGDIRTGETLLKQSGEFEEQVRQSLTHE